MQSIGRRRAIEQNLGMGENKSAGVLVRRPAAAEADGDSARADPGAGNEVELVSTQMLKQILCSKDVENRRGVADAAKRDGEGVLARDPETGYFVILDEDELKAIVESGQELPKLSRPSDVTVSPLHDYADSEHLSLVSVQALRRVLNDDDDAGAEESESVEAGETDFNPYCS
jgi:hypothetical protein